MKISFQNRDPWGKSDLKIMGCKDLRGLIGKWKGNDVYNIFAREYEEMVEAYSGDNVIFVIVDEGMKMVHRNRVIGWLSDNANVTSARFPEPYISNAQKREVKAKVKEEKKVEELFDNKELFANDTYVNDLLNSVYSSTIGGNSEVDSILNGAYA